MAARQWVDNPFRHNGWLHFFGDTPRWDMGMYPQRYPHSLWILAYQNGQPWTTEKEKAQFLLGFQDIHGLVRILGWCRRRDSNSHDRGPLPPQDSVSTSSTTSAKDIKTTVVLVVPLFFSILLLAGLQPGSALQPVFPGLVPVLPGSEHCS